MNNDLLNAARKAAEFLDGICIGHKVADEQRYEIAKALFAVIEVAAEKEKE